MLDINVVEILGYGLTGLAAICILASMFLIQKEGSKDNPNKEVLKTIRTFMSVCLVALLAVGVFSLPQLTKRNNLTDNSISKLAGDFATLNENYNAVSTDYEKMSEAYNELKESCNGGNGGIVFPGKTYLPVDPMFMKEIRNLEVKSITNKNLEFLLNTDVIKIQQP